jgi:hypothetical protein
VLSSVCALLAAALDFLPGLSLRALLIVDVPREAAVGPFELDLPQKAP